jgi:alanine racemase
MKSILKISLNDIKNNWKLINTASNGKAAAVVKANAYGMGMIEVAGALLESGCNYFYVANIYEGLKLRKKFNSNKISIAVFEGYLEGNQKIYAENDLTPILNNLEQLKRLKKFSISASEQKVIINIDTGMNRLGLIKKERDFLINNRDLLNNIKIDYIMSHLSNAQENENEINLLQFNELKKFSNNFPNIKVSFANSHGIKLGSNFCFDQTRPGIGLYGIDNFGKNFSYNSKKLKLPLKLYAPIIQIKKVNAGEKVSYGGIDILKRSSILATIGVGYADGWLRLLKANSVFLIGNEKCKIVGNVTMDSFVLDITDIKKNKLKEGDHICLLDNSNIEHVLKNSKIISYELLTLMGDRLHRNY